MTVRIGVDIGGTFTDVAAVGPDGRVHLGKRLTSVGAENEAVVSATIDSQVPWTRDTILAHGTTLVINALLERRIARTALVCTSGFADVHQLATDARPEPYCVEYRRDEPLIPQDMCFEIEERISASGSILHEPSEGELDALCASLRKAGPECIAIAFINSYIQPSHERLVRSRLEKEFPGVPVCLSSDISQSPREYQRITTAIANAAVSPLMRNYLGRLDSGVRDAGFIGDIVVLDSNGGAQSIDVAMKFPLRAIESGPVAGAIAARDLAMRHGVENAVVFDMGGTTAKSSLIENGRFLSTDLYWVGGYSRGLPTQVPCIDILEVGAGGGSIAWLEDGGRLQVGPRSAGSSPGPACYGLGGKEPTVTDANLYCGRLPQTHISGSLELDYDAAAAAFSDLAQRAGMDTRRVALGTLQLAVLSMARTVRRQTLERGRDPREFLLIACGGAGPMHACEVAREVGVRKVAIPMHPGHFSATGMLSADLRFERTWTIGKELTNLYPVDLMEAMSRVQDDLVEALSGAGASEKEIYYEYALNLRYVGQEHTLKIPAREAGVIVSENFAREFSTDFSTEYETRFGHSNDQSNIEVVQLELTGRRALSQPIIVPSSSGNLSIPETTQAWFGMDESPIETPVLDRASLSAGDEFSGPAIICEEGSTSVIPRDSEAIVLDDLTILVTLL
ncbi:MAG: hydantoinase/oxoprolinase family protein [Pseudomonadales bacterium]|jgi:N-methylhydantoinase A|tara:strand:- start:16083 stop:18122 length:2040 start_codon:yes stop_codon:yes gene_type:complete